jgi:hypothetical protein
MQPIPFTLVVTRYCPADGPRAGEEDDNITTALATFSSGQRIRINPILLATQKGHAANDTVATVGAVNLFVIHSVGA